MKGAVSSPHAPLKTVLRVPCKSLSSARLDRLMEKKKLKKLEKKYGQKDKESPQGHGQETRPPSGIGQAEGQEDQEV